MLAEPRFARVRWLGLIVSALLCARSARADPDASTPLDPVAASVEANPTPRHPADQTYETRRVELALASAGMQVDEAPEGKIIRFVRYERRRVFEGDDLPAFFPSGTLTWLNTFHWLTTESTVAREVLLHPSDRYTKTLAEETMRNLRDLEIFSLVRVVAVKTADPHTVDVLVYTRDLWSLRLEESFAGTGGVFALSGQLIERNFLGRDKALALRGSLEPFRYSVGETYLDPRVLSREFTAYESFDLFFDRAIGGVEGGVGTLELGRPFYNLAQRTAYDLIASYQDEVLRNASGANIVGFDATPANFGHSCAPSRADCIARVWRDRQLQVTAVGDYRIGDRYKQTFSLGGALIDHEVAADADTHLNPALADVFRRSVLPRVRRDVYPYVRYRLSLPRFVIFENLATFGQSENVQVGPILDGSLGVPLRAYGASSDGLVSHGLIEYVWARDDLMFDLAAEGLSRLEDRVVVDQHGVLRLRAATPSFAALFGRLVLHGEWDVHNHDTQNTLITLGGDNGLRGYGTQRFYAFGARRVNWNVEYRSRPVVIASVHLGAVLFYDAGSIYERLASARVHHAAGAGLRVLFPQFNRYVFRIDAGTPLDQHGFAVLISYGSDQVIPLTPAEDAFANSTLTVAP